MKQKNKKIGTFSRTKDRSGDVGEQKHGEEWKNFSENDNTFLAAVTSSKDVHAMHKTSKEQKSEKIHADFSGTSRVIVSAGNSFHKNLQIERTFWTAFCEKECEEDALPAQKIEKSAKSSPIFSNRPAERNRGQKSPATTERTMTMQHADKTVSGSSADSVAQGNSEQKIQFSAKSFQDSQNRPADIDRGHHMPTTTKKDKAMKTATITDSGSKPERKRSGILAGLSNLPIVNFFTSSAKKVTDFNGAEQASTLEGKMENLSQNFKNSAKNTNMHIAPYISPSFLPGMKLGDLLFTIAAVVAHSRRVKVDCRIPWAYSTETRQLRSALGMNALPGTLCGANEPVAYEEESYLYTPIPETVTSGGLCGYFQSGNYFADIEPIIRHLFAPLTAVEKIPGTVGIHITIGNDPFKFSRYRLTTAFFLQKAAARLSKDIREIVVFSDKPCEAVAMLVEFPEFAQYSFRVDQSKPCEQLRRMTAMQELVISNSALSWWAAWLGKPRKVIAPRCWFMHKAEQPPVFEASPWIVL